MQKSVDIGEPPLARTEKLRPMMRPKTQFSKAAEFQSIEQPGNGIQNHRRSNFGLDFLDIRREIIAEMKETNQPDRKIKLKTSLS